MNKTGHIKSLDHLFTLYSQSSNQDLQNLHHFYCRASHQDEDGNTRHLCDFIQHGVEGADYPDTHKCNDLAYIKTYPGASLIIEALKAGISAWQGESTENMLTRMYHFFCSSRNYLHGASLIDDPEAKRLLLALRLIDPVTFTTTFIEEEFGRCPHCLGTGRDPLFLFFVDCYLCGGDGEILEGLKEWVQEKTVWLSTVPIETAFGYFPDVVNHNFHSAEDMYCLYRKKAADLYDSNREYSLIYLGYGLHHLQDIASIPHHSLGIPFSEGHGDYEASITYDSILDSISWNNVEQKYNSLVSDFAENAARPQWRLPLSLVLFNWASGLSADEGVDNEQDFARTAVSMLAAMHHVLRCFYILNQSSTNELVMAKAKHAGLQSKIRSVGQPSIFHNLDKKVEKRDIRDSAFKREIKRISKDWVTQAQAALNRREPVPKMPPELFGVPKVIKTKRLVLRRRRISTPRRPRPIP